MGREKTFQGNKVQPDVTYNCPNCDTILSESVCLNSDGTDAENIAKPLDFTACGHCMTLARFDMNMDVKPLTLYDMEALPYFDMIQSLVLLQREPGTIQ